MAASATPCGVQSVSSGFEVMHVLHQGRKKHRETWLAPGEDSSTVAVRVRANTEERPPAALSRIPLPANENKRPYGAEGRGFGYTLTDRGLSQSSTGLRQAQIDDENNEFVFFFFYTPR